MKRVIRHFIPTSWLSLYHLFLAKLGAFIYGYPSEKMIVVGVTGTSGKSTTVFILHSLLAGKTNKVGSLSTIAFRIGDRFELNDKKMTMLGRFQTQKFLKSMVQAGCRYAIVETTSEGINQFRHQGIHYDLALFTNLHPEHIEAHGSFENYKKAKLKLFDYLASSRKKVLGGTEIPRTIIVNGDDELALEFSNFPVEKRWAYTLEGQTLLGLTMLRVEDVEIRESGVDFTIEGHKFHSPLRGNHNLKNVVAALTVARALDISWDNLIPSVASLSFVPGRLEYINEGQPWNVVVDYAFEPRAMESLYETLRPLKYQNIIQVLGGTGGGRDKARRPVLGKMAAQFADTVIVTNEDPYDEDPREIMEQVAAGAREGHKQEGENLLIIHDRRAAIRKAFSLAQPGSLVLITGKGSEQAIVGPGGVFTLWDDREVAREEIKNILTKK